MMLILRWLVMTAAVAVAAYVVPGVAVKGFFTALMVALFLGVMNVLIKPVLILITLPINILTLGLFTFVINALLVLAVSAVVKGFEVNGFWAAILFSIILSVVNFILSHLVAK